MSVCYAILKVVLVIIISLISLFVFYFLFKTSYILFKNRCRRKHHKLKFRLKHSLWHIRSAEYIKPVDFVKYVLIDFFSGKDYLKLFGIWAFTGYYGEGKTMGCVQFAKNLQKKYPHRNIKIFSNIYVNGAKTVHSWEEILNLPKNSIFIYDESQSDWSCNLGKTAFPEDLLRRLTQVRKKQFALFMTSPVFNRMNINIRESVNFVIVCKNFLSLDRYFSYTFYHADEYEYYKENPFKLAMHKYLCMSFVVSNAMYRQYHTLEEVGSIKDVKVVNSPVVVSKTVVNIRDAK